MSAAISIRRIIRKLIGTEQWGVLDSWERVGFDFAHYFPLRDAGFTHRQACAELDRLWNVRVQGGAT